MPRRLPEPEVVSEDESRWPYVEDTVLLTEPDLRSAIG